MRPLLRPLLQPALQSGISAGRCAPAWSPLSLNPALWLSDTGNNPSAWPDLSGNNRPALQAVGPSQPAILPSVLNGRQVRRWDGVNDYLQTSGAFLEGLPALTIYAVFRTAGTQPVANLGIICSAGLFGNFGSDILLTTDGTTNDGVVFQVNNGADGWARTSVSPDGWNIVAAVFNEPEQDPLAVFNASTGTSASSSVVSPATTAASLGLFELGRYSCSTNIMLNGDIAELIIYPAAHNPTQRQYMLAGLASKYNLPQP